MAPIQVAADRDDAAGLQVLRDVGDWTCCWPRQSLAYGPIFHPLRLERMRRLFDLFRIISMPGIAPSRLLALMLTAALFAAGGGTEHLRAGCPQDVEGARSLLTTEDCLQIEPSAYGTGVLSGPSDLVCIMSPHSTLLSTIAGSSGTRSGNGVGDAVIVDELVQQVAYVGMPVEPTDTDDPSALALPPQDELDNRQPLALDGPFEEIVKKLTQELARIEGLLGGERSEEWVKRLQSARDLLTAARSHWEEAHKLEARLQSAPQRIIELQQILAQPQVPSGDFAVPQSASESQQQLDAAKQALQKHNQDFDQLQKAMGQRAQTKTEVETELATLRKRLAEFALLPAPAEETADAEMMRLESRIQLLILRTQLLRISRKLALHEGTGELSQLERDVAQRQMAELQSRVESIEQQVTKLRRKEVQYQAAQAEREAAQVQLHAPSLAVIAENNSALVGKRAELGRKLESIGNELKSIIETVDKVKQSRQRLNEKIERAGMNQSVGTLMLVHRRELPGVWGQARRIREFERELPEIQLTRIELEECRDEVADVNRIVEATLQDLQTVDNVEVTPETRHAVEELFTTQKQLVQDLILDVDRYIDQLFQCINSSRELIDQTRESEYFVDKHVLWIRSNEPLTKNDLGKVVSAFVAISRAIQPELAQFEWKTFVHRARQYGGWAIALLIAGLLTRRRLLQFLDRLAARSTPTAGRLGIVVQMVVLMLLVASFWPAVFWGIGSYLGGEAFDNTSAAGALGKALLAVLPFITMASALRQLTCRNAVAATHLGWDPDMLCGARRALRCYVLAVLPLRGIGLFFDYFQDGRWASSAGRGMFILSQVCLFVCLSIGIRQISAAMTRLRQTGSRSLWVRTQRIWCAAIALAPLMLAILSVVGYHYSASELSYRFGWTVWLILWAAILVALAQMIVQIVLNSISLRRFWLERAMEENPTGTEATDDFDTDSIGRQIGGLIRGFTVAGVALSAFLIWSQVLPAFQILDQVEIWNVHTEVVENQPGPDGKVLLGNDGAPVTKTVRTLKEVTLADLTWALICLGLTLILSRNLPGLLEVTLLDRLPLDRGGKYAICVVSRYIVAIVGCIVAARGLGFEWSSVQWLVAAMSVGLGFGLQEIFGNFVSGLIILMERPIRVGDLVTVNGTTGIVTRIQLRATTITDVDRREMVVPNKKFITDDVINWTLTDSITRMVIPVGIAYGSDTELACRTLLEVARANPNVLSDPEPNAVLNRFGASSLDLELRVYLPNREHFPEVQHQLHMAIDKAFREKRIEIAFPQQDIHIRTSDDFMQALAPHVRASESGPRNSAAA
jgi:potassium efflux system protein